MSIAALVIWALCAAGLFAPAEFAVFLLFGCAPFGALSLLPAEAGAGNLPAQAVAALVLAARMGRDPKTWSSTWRAVSRLQGFVLLAAFAAYALFTAVVLPAVFAGRIDVVPLNRPELSPLAPTPANLNQAAYLALDLIAALALFTFLETGDTSRRRETLLQALLVAGVLLIVTGLIDYLGLAPAFEASFKTATYLIQMETEIAHYRRIPGFFSEPSAFGAACVATASLLFFVRPAFRSVALRDWGAPVVTCLLVALAVLSTSSTAYLEAGAFAALVGVRIAYGLARGETPGEVRVELAIAGFILALAGGVALFLPDLMAVPVDLIDRILVKKVQTGSYYQRQLWNHFAQRAFLQSYGLGVGAGSTRTSNWLIGLVSNTGLIGTTLMGAFAVYAFMLPLSKRGGRAVALARGAKFASGAYLAGLLVAGATVDPGLHFSVLFAFIKAGSAWARDGGSGRRARRRHRRRSTLASVEDAGPGPTPEPAVIRARNRSR